MGMAFTRTKKIAGKTYYYLVEAYRVGGKPKQRVLKYLGAEKPSLEEIEKIIKDVKK